MSKTIHCSKAPQFPLPFSHAVRAGDFVYVSGQVGVDPHTREIVGGTIEEQTAGCFRNVELILAEEGLTLDHVIKSNVYVSKMSDVPKFNEVYEKLFKAPYPARTTVESGVGQYLIEVDVVAYARSRRGEG